MSDTHAACMNFVNALEKIPGIIAQYEERTARLKADVPQLEAIISKPWGKEDELKQLKSELAALDRKITAELAPNHEEKDGVENSQTAAQTVDVPSQSEDAKKSMVAEPATDYVVPRRFSAVPDSGIPSMPEEGCKRDREHTVNPVCSLPYKMKNAPQVCCLATRLRSLLSL